MTEPVRHLVVGRLRKPHGLKGNVTVFPLTDDPETVYAEGQELWLKDLDGEFVGEPLVVEMSAKYHREWLLKFKGIDRVEVAESLRGLFVTVPDSRLAPPAPGEVYLHELEGFTVRHLDGTPLGIVSALYDLPSGLMIEVQGPKREFLLPFKKEFVPEVDREARRLIVSPPDGLLED